MSWTTLLDNTIKPYENIVCYSINANGTGTASGSAVGTLQITEVLLQSSGAVNVFTGSSGGTYSPAAALLPNGVFYYAGAGAVNFAMPSIVSLATYLSGV